MQARPGNAQAAPPAAGNQQQSATQAAAAAVAAAMAKLGPVQGGQDSVDNLTKKVGEMRTSDHTRQPRGPGPAGFAPGNRGGRGGRRPSTREQTKVEVPTTDFDFEGSNAKFNKQDLVKEAIATGSPLGTPAAEVDGENKNPLDGETNGAKEEDVVIPAATYNKTTSFFDNISSELKDRNAAQEDGKKFGGQEFRREERTKNFETFGQGSVDTGFGRGGYRGRGRGRGFGGRGRGFSGGRGGFVPRGGVNGASRGGRGASAAAESA